MILITRNLQTLRLELHVMELKTLQSRSRQAIIYSFCEKQTDTAAAIKGSNCADSALTAPFQKLVSTALLSKVSPIPFRRWAGKKTAHTRMIDNDGRLL